MSKGAAFGLLVAGGVISLLVSGVVGLIGAGLSLVPVVGGLLGAAVGVYALWGIIVGLVMIWSGVRINSGKPDARTWSIISLVLSIIGLITGVGLFIGSILGIIGAAIGLGETKQKK